MKKPLLSLLKIILVAALLATLFEWHLRSKLLQGMHDLMIPNPVIKTAEQVDSVLSILEQVPYGSLDSSYITYAQIEKHVHASKLKEKAYYLVYVWDLNRKVAGNLRIKDFICRDKYLKRITLNWGESAVWLIERRILHKLVQLQNELEKRGNDPTGFSIQSGHRHPRNNSEIKGASQSRHILGEAVDLHIGDINRDGGYSQVDKQIVLDIADKTVIAHKGGIGRYPGTREVHLDVRGWAARWNSY